MRSLIDRRICASLYLMCNLVCILTPFLTKAWLPENFSGHTTAMIPITLICISSILTLILSGVVVSEHFFLPEDSEIHLRIVSSTLMIGVSGFICFFIWCISAKLGKIYVYLFHCVCFGLACLKSRANDLRSFYVPLCFNVLIAAFYLSIALDHGGLNDGSMALAHRYWVSVDNKIPLFFSNLLDFGLNGIKLLQMPGDWHYSDRPPLQTGLMLLLWINNYSIQLRDIFYVLCCPGSFDTNIAIN